jgi:AcrR family transcriptional regulator
MPDPPRSRLATDERRAQLLDLGVRLFSRRPYDEVSIDDIAAEAGISKGLLYHYFGGKRDFYVAVVREAASRLGEATSPDPTLSPRDRAITGLEAYLDFVDARAEAFTALMQGGLGTDPEIAAILEGTRASIEARFLEGLGLDAPRPVFRLAIRSWLGAVERASLHWLEHRDVDRETLVALLLPVLAAHLVLARRLDPEAGVVLDEVEALVAAFGAST